ncbi:hypothetical protein HPA02_34550 [Bisbaumannia pacifica]|uniref:Uncharacterized protein n=1 Tax=Bisbaumannia pacifica TaxID=77098 RepID=A0A510XCK7_9GAMM|nr:hypothetical protein [Halomonas pacifica]GEK49172.1 hypothetical protein HPA02_34550 [Halomonas pacifica]
MRKLIASLLATTALGLASQVAANCNTIGSTTSCYDSQSGNRYSIQQYGNQTHMRGSNSRTGSRWSQDSSTYGNTTHHRGRDANGNTWRSTTQGSRGNGNLVGPGSCGIAGCQ